jgi:hypothetical protein
MKAASAKPEIITRNGKAVSVILSIKEYQDMIERLEDVDDLAWLRRLASNCFVANIPKCISIRSRSDCAKTAGTNADYVSELRAIKMV